MNGPASLLSSWWPRHLGRIRPITQIISFDDKRLLVYFGIVCPSKQVISGNIKVIRNIDDRLSCRLQFSQLIPPECPARNSTALSDCILFPACPLPQPSQPLGELVPRVHIHHPLNLSQIPVQYLLVHSKQILIFFCSLRTTFSLVACLRRSERSILRLLASDLAHSGQYFWRFPVLSAIFPQIAHWSILLSAAAVMTPLLYVWDIVRVPF